MNPKSVPDRQFEVAPTSVRLGIEQVKTFARALQKAQRTKLSSSLSYAQCLDVIASALGYTEYRALLAAEKNKKPLAEKPASESPQERLRRLEAQFESQGGRGVELADEIDALRAQIDAEPLPVFRHQGVNLTDLALIAGSLELSGDNHRDRPLFFPLTSYAHPAIHVGGAIDPDKLLDVVKAQLEDFDLKALIEQFHAAAYIPRIYARVQLQKTLSNDSIVDLEEHERIVDVTDEIMALPFPMLSELEDNDETSDALVAGYIEKWGHRDCFTCHITEALSTWLSYFGHCLYSGLALDVKGGWGGFLPIKPLTQEAWAEIREKFCTIRNYEVTWSKLYGASGTLTVQAKSAKEAEGIVYDRLGDLEGSLQYLADKDEVSAVLKT